MNNPISRVYINKSREDSVISLLECYLEIYFELMKKADKSRYANCNNIPLGNLGPIALFDNFELTTSSGKYLDDISHAHIFL